MVSTIRSFDMSDFSLILSCNRFRPAGGSNTSKPNSQTVSAGVPSNLRPASSEILPASTLLCENSCQLLAEDNSMGTNVGLPKMLRNNNIPNRRVSRSVNAGATTIHEV